MNLSNKYDSITSERMDLYGEKIQTIAIVQVLISNPYVLIFDGPIFKHSIYV
ncbi:hypothetical protein [Clostridium tepidiprofundi]|uniref:hypothetical protein n=1 Tax=Clostridium tepidiprofundi TaxID=420412 RepID=UPI001A9A649A|nr:hypothetical protein [Clostridium tepidiprofundi]